MRYEKFDGVKRKTVTVKEGTTVELKVSVTTEAGTLAISVEHKDGTVAYRGTELPTPLGCGYLYGHPDGGKPPRLLRVFVGLNG